MASGTFGFSTVRISSVPDGTSPPTGAEMYRTLSATAEPYTTEDTVPDGATVPNRCRLLGVEILMEDTGDITDTSIMLHLSKGPQGEHEIWNGSLDINCLHAATDGVYYASARKTFDQPIPYVNTRRAIEADPSTGPGTLDTNRLYCYIYGSTSGGYHANVQLFWEADGDFHV